MSLHSTDSRTIRRVLAAAAAAGLLLLAAACGAGSGEQAGAGGAAEPAASGPKPHPKDGFTLEGVGFATPESALHDVEADVYLVSNINGGPSAKDDNGFISRVSPDGTLLALKWIDGAAGDGVTLHAPKGMAIVGGKLYVADLDRVRIFDRETGAPAGEIAIAGSTFLNDVVADGKGGIWISDSGIRIDDSGVQPTGTDALYHVSADGAVRRAAAGNMLARPNGLAMYGDALVMATFGSNRVLLFDGSRLGRVFGETPAGSLDGLVLGSDGRLLVSSWESETIYVVDGQKEPFPIADGLPAPADFGLDGTRYMLLVPLFNDDKLVVRPLGA